jgi:hypothetical protein
MSHAKQPSKRMHRACAVPLLGAAGLSLSLASGAPAATEGPAADMPTQNTGMSHEITLGEEEISDVSLATFYVFDKENPPTLRSPSANSSCMAASIWLASSDRSESIFSGARRRLRCVNGNGAKAQECRSRHNQNQNPGDQCDEGIKDFHV